MLDQSATPGSGQLSRIILMVDPPFGFLSTGFARVHPYSGAPGVTRQHLLVGSEGWTSAQRLRGRGSGPACSPEAADPQALGRLAARVEGIVALALDHLEADGLERLLDLRVRIGPLRDV